MEFKNWTISAKLVLIKLATGTFAALVVGV